jgi:hypothetical protein
LLFGLVEVPPSETQCPSNRHSQAKREGLERRIMDKIDENRDKASENQKWIIGLLILSMLIPLLIALVTK